MTYSTNTKTPGTGETNSKILMEMEEWIIRYVEDIDSEDDYFCPGCNTECFDKIDWSLEDDYYGHLIDNNHCKNTLFLITRGQTNGSK